MASKTGASKTGALKTGASGAGWRRRLRSAALVLLLSAGSAAAETPAGKTLVDKTPVEEKISSFLLDNGMEVVVIPDRRAPIVTHMVWY